MKIKNFAPHADAIHLSTKKWEVSVWRDEHGTVHVGVINKKSKSPGTRMVLGHVSVEEED